ncbi:MAG: DUF4442 domain-containing protein [Bacteroidota bacterium]
MQLQSLVTKARQSKRGMAFLNWAMQREIPFNKPHRFRILEISENRVQVAIPYRKSNLNHIKGLHACAMATACEYASGLLLLTKLGEKNYRLIMESMHMAYHYQGKTDAVATFEISDERLQKEALEPLQSVEKVVLPCEILLHDAQGNHLCTGTTHWQLKRWDKVKTKL